MEIWASLLYSGCRKTLIFRVWFASSWARESTFHFISSSDHVFRQEIMSTDLWFNIQSIEFAACAVHSVLPSHKPSCFWWSLSVDSQCAYRGLTYHTSVWPQSVFESCTEDLRHDYYQWLKSINLFHSF